MAESVKRKVHVLDAEYSDEAKSILIVGECQEGKFRNQIHRNCFSYGNRSEPEIINELKKTADMMKGKVIDMIFDPDLDKRIDENGPLNY